MTFNTGNNVPSTDPRDLYDNAENLDKLVNGVDPFYADRKGILRQSWAGMENDFDTSQEGRENTFTLSQAYKESRFQAFLVSSGYVSKGDYAAGVVLAERNEYVFVSAATTGTTAGLYFPSGNAAVPLTMTGDWATDLPMLALREEDVLRQELSGENGAAILGLGGGPVSAALPGMYSDYAGLRAAVGSKAIVYGTLFQADYADTTSVENLPFVVVGDTGIRWKWVQPAIIDARLFGAVPGTSADNSAAIQKAIDYCLSFTTAKSLIVSERYRIASSLMVDNPVDASAGEFYVIGVNGGGFYVDTAITLFSSRLPYGVFLEYKAPPSEYLHFKEVRFEASAPTLAAYVISDKLLRLTFDSCQFRNIKCLENADYVQSIAFIGKNLMRAHQGIFFRAGLGYDVDASGVNFEISGPGFQFDLNCNGFKCSGLYEGSVGPFFNGAVNVGDFNMYFEANSSPDLIIPGGTFRISSHFALTSEQANPANDFWPIVLGGGVDSATIQGCTSNGGLCNNSAAKPFAISKTSNAALGREYREHPYVDGAFAAAGTTQATAAPIRREITVVTGGAGGVKLPALTTRAKYERLTVRNSTGAAISLYPFANERFAGIGYDLPVSIAAESSVTVAFMAGDSWVII